MKDVKENNSAALVLYGAGGHCKVVMDILESCGRRPDLVVDDNPVSSEIMSVPCCRPLSGAYDSVIVTIGNCNIRKKIVGQIQVARYEKAIHPSAIISSHSTVGTGSVVMQGAVLQTCASVGRHCIINTNSVVEHDVIVHDFVHVAPGAVICGGSELGECTWLGAGSVVKQGIKIGKNCMIGAGSVVVKDIPDNVVAFGNPCRVIKSVYEN